ncbi:MAG: serine/threonine-protein kinase [Acidobacteriota bacterium]
MDEKMPMDAKARWRQIRDCFDQASTRTGAARTAYLDAACADDPDLRREVEALLDADRRAAAAFKPQIGAAADQLLAPSVQPDDRLGAYRIVEERGRGGMGVVYQAARDDGAYAQRVAIKVMSRYLATEAAVQRFENERQILAHLAHPAIARLLDGGTTDDGAPYLVMEFVEGEPIDVHCRRRAARLDARLDLFLQVAEAVAHAHARLVVHRDLKPANILVTDDGAPKLLDFGIAKILDDERQTLTTRTGTLPLTPRYASPEQVAGAPITVATDVYSLGVVLYELLSGASPYGAVDQASPARLAQAIADVDPVRLGVAARRMQGTPDAVASVPPSRLDGELEAIVATALRKEPARRYATVDQLAADLRRYRTGQPVTAVPDSFGYRAGKWLKRNALPAALGLLVVVALVAGLVARTVEARRAERQTELAQLEAAASNQVAAFLEGVFDSAAPMDADSQDVTARALLDAAVGRIDQLDDQPFVQARVLRVMGRSYKELGQLDDAEQLLTRALAALDAAPEAGPDHYFLVHSALGNALKESQQPAEAETQFRAALTQLAQTARKGSTDHIKILRQLGLMLSHQRRLDEAEMLLVEAVGMAERLPQPHLDTQLSLHFVLGSLYADQGDLERSHASMKEGLRLARMAYGDDHQATVIGLINVGQGLLELGRFDEAAPHVREAVTRATAFLPLGHPLVVTAQRNLGALLARQGQLDEAETVLQTALEGHTALYGPDQFLTQLVRSSLARIALRRGQLDAADADFATALAAIEPSFGSEHHVVAELLHVQGELRQRQGRVEEARALFDRALAIRETVFGPDGAPTRATRAARDALGDDPR